MSLSLVFYHIWSDFLQALQPNEANMGQWNKSFTTTRARHIMDLLEEKFMEMKISIGERVFNMKEKSENLKDQKW